MPGYLVSVEAQALATSTLRMSMPTTDEQAHSICTHHIIS